jgi:CIC family chloride channel protein
VPTAFSSTTSTRRLLQLSGLAAILGLAGGGAAWVLLHLIALLTNLALFHRWGWQLPSFRNLHPTPWLVVAAVSGAFLVSLLARWAPMIRGHGLPEAMEAILTHQSRISPRAAIAKPLSAALAIGTGGPFGAEGPIIVTGGALGSLIGQLLPVSPAERKILVASGAAAGMAATFGAPLAAVVLAIELLLFEFSTRAFIPLVVAASVAGGAHAALFGSGPLFAVPAHDYTGLARLPLYVLLGGLCGLLAVGLSKGLFLIEDGFRRLPIGEFWHPVIGAVGFGVVGLAVPRALGVGYDAITDTLLGRLAVGGLVILGLAKLVAWWVALASGTSGGTLAPILLMGATFGGLIGHAANALAPGLHVDPGAFALVAMAATFGAATRATFTAIVFVFELTGDYHVILPLMLAAVVADLVASGLMTESLMTEKLSRRGLTVRADYEVDILRTTPVATIMTTEVNTLGAGATVGDALRAFRATGHGAYPLVDGAGACTGIVTRGDLLRQGLDERAPVTSIATADPVVVSPTTLAFDALHAMLQDDVEHLPVVDGGGRLVGICSRTDLLRTRLAQLEHERPQPGWHLPSVLRSARTRDSVT